jgi:hypothetical protein
MELILGLVFFTSWLVVAPKVIADAVATMRASKAGAWDTIDKQRDRKDKRSASRREAMSKAWATTRAARNKRAGGTGKYRPGASAYLGDLYHGFWEDKLEKRQVNRAARPAYEYDPNKPKLRDRFDAKLAGKVAGLRERSGRFGRALIDPVGERRQPADVVPPAAPTQRAPEWEEFELLATDAVDTGGPTNPLCVLCHLDLAVTTIPAIGQEDPLPACPTCLDEVLDARRAQEAKQRAARSAREMPQVPVSSVVRDSDEYVIKPAPRTEVTAEEIDANLQRLAPDCQECGTRMTVPKYEGPGLTVGILESYVSEPYTCPNCGAQVGMNIDHFTGANRVIGRRSASEARTTGTNPTNQGDTMTTATDADVLPYNDAVAEHESALQKLQAQLGEALAFDQHITASVAALEVMDGERTNTASALGHLSEGLEHGRYGVDATQGAVEATSSLTAGSIAEVQEHIEAAGDRNKLWMQELNASIEGVQASLQSIKSQYGEAATTVQETGIDGRALEDH